MVVVDEVVVVEDVVVVAETVVTFKTTVECHATNVPGAGATPVTLFQVPLAAPRPRALKEIWAASKAATAWARVSPTTLGTARLEWGTARDTSRCMNECHLIKVSANGLCPTTDFQVPFEAPGPLVVKYSW